MFQRNKFNLAQPKKIKCLKTEYLSSDINAGIPHHAQEKPVEKIRHRLYFNHLRFLLYYIRNFSTKMAARIYIPTVSFRYFPDSRLIST